MFSFPKDDETLKEWIRAIQREDFVPNPYSKVCDGHFEASCVIWHTTYTDPKTGRVLQAPRQRPRLRPGSVPTLFPDCFSLCKGRKRHSHCAAAVGRLTLNTKYIETGIKRRNAACRVALLPRIPSGTVSEVEPLQLVATVLQELPSQSTVQCITKRDSGAGLPMDTGLLSASAESCKMEQERGTSLSTQLDTCVQGSRVPESCEKERETAVSFPPVSNEADLHDVRESCEQERRAASFSSLEELDLRLRSLPMRESWVVVRRDACTMFLDVVNEREPCVRASVTVFSDLRVSACYRGSQIKTPGVVRDVSTLTRVLDNLRTLSDDSNGLSAAIGVLFDKLERSIGEEKQEHLRFLKEQVLFLAKEDEEEE